MSPFILVSIFSGISSIILAFIVIKIRNKKAAEVSNHMSFVKPFKASNTANTFFELIIKEAFYIAGRGVVVTGNISKGTLRIGDDLYYKNSHGVKKEVRVKAIERGRKTFEEAHQGEGVGVLITGITKEEVKSGDRLISKS